MLADELHKDTLFKVTLTVPKSFLNPRQTMDSEDMSTSNEVAIRVIHKQRGTDSVWSLETLEEKVLTMREMYERMEEGGPLLVSQHVELASVLASHRKPGKCCERKLVLINVIHVMCSLFGYFMIDCFFSLSLSLS